MTPYIDEKQLLNHAFFFYQFYLYPLTMFLSQIYQKIYESYPLFFYLFIFNQYLLKNL